MPLWFQLALATFVVVPVLVGLWISGPPKARDKMRGAVAWVIGSAGCLLWILLGLGVVGASIFGVVRLIRIAWGP